MKVDDYYFSPFLLKRSLTKHDEIANLAQSDPKYISLITLILSKKYADPSYVALAMIYTDLFDIEISNKKEVRELQLEYFNTDQLTKMMNYESPSLVEKMEQIRPICYFLNDIALGFYKTISETKNIFSENRQLSKQ